MSIVFVDKDQERFCVFEGDLYEFFSKQHRLFFYSSNRSFYSGFTSSYLLDFSFRLAGLV